MSDDMDMDASSDSVVHDMDYNILNSHFDSPQVSNYIS